MCSVVLPLSTKVIKKRSFNLQNKVQHNINMKEGSVMSAVNGHQIHFSLRLSSISLSVERFHG